MTHTPQAVLDAGRRERERWIWWTSAGSDHAVLTLNIELDPVSLPVFEGSQDECQGFIDDRVRRAELRAYVPLITEQFAAALFETTIHAADGNGPQLLIQAALLALAGDDHG